MDRAPAEPGRPEPAPRLGLRGAPRRLALGLVLLLVASASAFWGWRSGGPPDLDAWREPIETEARRTGLDPALLRSVIAAESGGRPTVRSSKGARGLMQLMPATAREEAARLGLPLGPDGLDDPATNVRLGASYLSRLLVRFDGVEVFAVAAYNAGPAALQRWRIRAPDASPTEVVEREGYAETRAYVRRVMALKEHYRK